MVAKRRRLQVAALILAALVVGKNQIHASLTSPLAANDIHEMHHQMQRFVVGYWRDSVGVNDIGWVSLHNPYYVLDLWGLGSEEARRGRLGTAGNDWAEALAGERQVDLLIIFGDWFARSGPLPPTWEKVAVLDTGGPFIQILKSVDIYLRNPERRSELVRALEEFRPTLPPQAEIRLLR